MRKKAQIDHEIEELTLKNKLNEPRKYSPTDKEVNGMFALAKFHGLNLPYPKAGMPSVSQLAEDATNSEQ